jgi:D-alanyl-D-alanine endopeptidase (penicillin-binding protein 7)
MGAVVSILVKSPPASPRRWPAILSFLLLVLLATPSAEAAGREARSGKPVAKAPVKAKASARAAPRARSVAQPRRASVVRVAPARPSFGQVFGLHATDDPLDLKSSVALVVDQDTRQVLFSKNPEAVLPIASITKLMTALVVTEAGLPLDEVLTITQDDVDTEKGSRSRLNVGTQLSRGEMLHLALMSSENRAAHALGRNYPGGLDAFVGAMNAKAQQLGMAGTRYVEPTGLSSRNQSSATDLARLVEAAYAHPIIRELSTMPEAQVAVGSRQLQFRNTNGLVRNPEWAIGLQKTGYISEAGRCVVMQAQLAGRKLIMVLLDSAGRYSRIGDAERIRRWLDQGMPFGTALDAAAGRARP